MIYRNLTFLITMPINFLLYENLQSEKCKLQRGEIEARAATMNRLNQCIFLLDESY